VVLVCAIGVAVGPRVVPTHAQQQGEAPACSRPLSDPVTIMNLPSLYPTPTRDGCWVFSVITDHNSVAGDDQIAVLRRTQDGFEEVRSFPLKVPRMQGAPVPFGMALTPDEKVLIASHGTHITFFDVARLKSGGDPVLGSMSGSRISGSWGLSVSADNAYAFAAQSNIGAVAMIDLAKARSSGFDLSALAGMIPTAQQALFPLVSADGRYLFSTALRTPDVLEAPRTCAGGKETESAVQVTDVARAKVDPRSAVIGFALAGCRPTAMAISPDGTRLSVAAGGVLASPAAADTSVMVFDVRPVQDGKPPSVVAKIPMAASPVGLADNGRHIVVSFYPPNPNDATLKAIHATVIDASKLTLGKGAIIGRLPFPIFYQRFSADGRTLFVSVGRGAVRPFPLAAIDLERARLEPLEN
jgi:hypothetical protein